MIKNIQCLKQFGIFRNHANAQAEDFGKYNLFYGCNGTGKSTLSSLFRCIESRTPPEKFPAGEFRVNVEGGSAITQENVEDADLNIRTFNRDFIDENISWDGIVESILLFDKEKIAKRGELEELRRQQEADREEHDKKEEEMQDLKNAIEEFCTNSARRIKKSLRVIDPNDSDYMNYDKRNFKAFIDKNLEATKSNESLLDDQILDELTKAAKPDEKSEIFFNPQTIGDEDLIKEKAHLEALLNTSVVNQTIQRLAEHGDINEWIEAGLALHKRHKMEQCEFCGNGIPGKRIRQLEAHFNDDYKTLQGQLAQADQALYRKHAEWLPALPPENGLYEEFWKEYNASCTALKKASAALHDEITAWHNTLKEKMENPFLTGLTVTAIKTGTSETFNDAVTAIREVVGKHNRKTTAFQKEIHMAKKKLELHYATEEIKAFKYHEKQKELRDQSNKNKELKAVIDKRETGIRTIEASLSGEVLGASQFNESLHKFLGRGELTLRFDSDSQGYTILRNDSSPVRNTLSESEKTAIAFVYFITKLKERDNNIEDTIVVVDDPVSSFDSQHLFNACSFMKINCEEAKQLFVLTHNFAFFKLVRDWMRKSKDRDQDANFYVIEASNRRPRSATFTNAGEALTHYNSEYHYIFSRLDALKGKRQLDLNDCFLAANLARRVLEAFLSFKFPKYRGNFAELFHAAERESAAPEDKRREKILKFVNQYSHSDLIATNEDSIENLMGESPAVIEDIFSWMKELDNRHYEEMMDVVRQ